VPPSNSGPVILKASIAPDFISSEYEAVAQQRVRELKLTQTLVQFYDE
jgi:hypothetical protein